MKVPIYKEKIARTKTAGGGTLLSAQANPNAWSAMGRALSDVGDTVYKIGMEKYKIQAQADVNETIPIFTAEIESVKEKYANSSNPVQAQQKLTTELMKVYKKYSSGKVKNKTGSFYLSNNLSKSAFGTKASQLVTAGVLDWKKKNNLYMIELNKTNKSKAISDNVKIASNPTLSIEERDAALNANFAVTFYDKNKKQDYGNYKNMPGGLFAQAAKEGTFKSKELFIKQNKALENIVLGISSSLVQNATHSTYSVTQLLRGNDIEAIKKVDPILAKVWSKLENVDKAKYIKKIRTAELNLKKDRADAKKLKIEADNLGNEKIRIEIINTDFSNPKAKAEALEKFNSLKKKEFFTKTNELKSMETLFEVDEDPTTTQKTVQSIFRTLDLLDQKNILTEEAIYNAAPQLSKTDFRAFLKRLKTEKSDASKYVVKTVINGSFFIDGLNNNDESEEEFDKMRMASQNAFNDWLQKNGTATYAEIVAKGEEIMQQPKITIAAMYKASFDSEVMKFKAVTNFKKGFEKSYPNGKYTLVNIMRHLVSLDISKPQPKSYSKRFKNFLGLPGANEWNN